MRPSPWLALGLLCLPVAVGGQQPLFRTDTHLVVVHATVRDGRGALVTTLNRDAFTVYENGKRQPIAVFQRDDQPVSLGLLIDNSGSMRTIRSKVEAAALALARASNPQDEMFVLNFNDKARIDVPFTSDPRVLEAGIRRVDAIGGTAMRDAVDLGQTYLSEHGTRDRKVLVIVTDGIDNASLVTAEQVERQAEQRDTVVFAVGLFGDAEKNGPGGTSSISSRTRPAASRTTQPASTRLVRSRSRSRARSGTNTPSRTSPRTKRSTARIARSGSRSRARGGYPCEPARAIAPRRDQFLR